MTIVFLKGCIVLYIVLYLSISIALLTAGAFQKRSRPQQLTLCRSLHAEALQAIAGKELAQGPYMAARAGFEPMTLRSNGVVSTNAPPCPTIYLSILETYIAPLQSNYSEALPAEARAER